MPTAIKIRPKDLLWIAYGLALLVYGAVRGPVTSDEALYWIIRRSYSFALFHFPVDAVLHGVRFAEIALLQSLDGAGAVSFYGKPLLFFLTIPLSIVSLQYITLILPTVIAVTIFFAYGVRRLSHPLALCIWCVLFAASPLMWLFGPSATGNALAGFFLVFAIISVNASWLRPNRGWFLFGLFLTCSVLSHYSIIPAAAFICVLTLVVKRREENLKTFLYFACGALAPLVVTLIVTFGLQMVFSHFLGPDAFLNYAQDLMRQLHGVAQRSVGSALSYYPHILIETAGFQFFVLIAAVLACATYRQSMRDFRFHAGWLAFVVGLIAISVSPARAGRTLLDILPAAYLAMLVLLESAPHALANLTKNVRIMTWGIVSVLSLGLVFFCMPRLTDVIRYRDLGNQLQRVVVRTHPEYGANPYIEGYLFHFFRFAFLSHVSAEELQMGWRQHASIWTFESEVAGPGVGQAFVDACLTQRHGVLEHMNWNTFSMFDWTSDQYFGEQHSSPFVMCFAPPHQQ